MVPPMYHSYSYSVPSPVTVMALHSCVSTRQHPELACIIDERSAFLAPAFVLYGYMPLAWLKGDALP